MARLELNLDLNRAEGDLEIALVVEDGRVVEARTIGTMYRGFEQILVGRAPRDAMVITPRVCGICGTAHLYAAVLALEDAWRVTPPPNAVRIRNLCLLAEAIQSDLRQTFLFFAPDFCQDRYRSRPGFDDFLAAFEPFRGQVYLKTLAVTRQVVRIVAEFGGQWPHSSYMLPGGVTMGPEPRRLTACRAVLDVAQAFYEEDVVGAPLDAWLSGPMAGTPVESAWGRLSGFIRGLDLHRRGAGTPHLISVGTGFAPAGIFDGTRGEVLPFDPQQVNEHVRHSWFRPYPGGRHPWQGETIPDYQPATDRYTWAKAPRYGEMVMQTGPLAELIVGGDALLTDLHRREGDSAWLRQLARVRRLGYALRLARQMLDELDRDAAAPHFIPPPPGAEQDGLGCGLVMAARGALGHWISIRDGRIERYQIITPTAWNASPRDAAGRPGHWEQSLVGLRVNDADDTAEIGHIIRSHDPCLVCTVHFLGSGRRLRVPV